MAAETRERDFQSNHETGMRFSSSHRSLVFAMYVCMCGTHCNLISGHLTSNRRKLIKKNFRFFVRERKKIDRRDRDLNEISGALSDTHY